MKASVGTLNQSGAISQKFKTYKGEEKKIVKFFDLRSKQSESFYLENDFNELFETEIKIKGFFFKKLENVEKSL